MVPFIIASRNVSNSICKNFKAKNGKKIRRLLSGFISVWKIKYKNGHINIIYYHLHEEYEHTKIVITNL
jgi:hypothetical protein